MSKKTEEQLVNCRYFFTKQINSSKVLIWIDSNRESASSS